jgi:hypothetical protein
MLGKADTEVETPTGPQGDVEDNSNKPLKERAVQRKRGQSQTPAPPIRRSRRRTAT